MRDFVPCSASVRNVRHLDSIERPVEPAVVAEDVVAAAAAAAVVVVAAAAAVADQAWAFGPEPVEVVSEARQRSQPKPLQPY